jgi:hypothetical protein
MATENEIARFANGLATIYEGIDEYFKKAGAAVPAEHHGDVSRRVDIAAEFLGQMLLEEAESLREKIRVLAIEITGAARAAPLIVDADLSDLRTAVRKMLAAIMFRRYKYWPPDLLGYEDVVYGMSPASQSETPVSLNEAIQIFHEAAYQTRQLILLTSSPPHSAADQGKQASSYRPNTAFIMMAINPEQPELDDIRNGIKDVCREFGVIAETIDEGHFDDGITDCVLEAIESREFLIADLTWERPNVYYEIGHAHARNKRVQLYCKVGTKVHFDIQHRKYQQYANVTELKKLLRRRMEVVTGKPNKMA